MTGIRLVDTSALWDGWKELACPYMHDHHTQLHVLRRYFFCGEISKVSLIRLYTRKTESSRTIYYRSRMVPRLELFARFFVSVEIDLRLMPRLARANHPHPSLEQKNASGRAHRTAPLAIWGTARNYDR